MALERYLDKHYITYPEDKKEKDIHKEILEKFWDLIPDDLLKLIDSDPICDWWIDQDDINRWKQLSPEQKKVMIHCKTLKSFKMMYGYDKFEMSIHVLRRFPSDNYHQDYVNECLDSFAERYNLLVDGEIIAYDEVLDIGGISYNSRCTDLVFYMNPATMEENEKIASFFARVPSYTPLPLECIKYWKEKYANDDNKITYPDECHLVLDFLINALEEEHVLFGDEFDPCEGPPMCRMYG